MSSISEAKENLDGIGLVCIHEETRLHFRFDTDFVSEWTVDYNTPLSIYKTKLSKYGTYPEGIYWSYNPIYSYQLLRKNLQLNLTYWGKDGNKKVTEYKCQRKTHGELEDIFNKKMDKIRATMKKNKL
jgi:hypothetical protein